MKYMKYKIVANSLRIAISNVEARKIRALANTSNQDIEDLLEIVRKRLRSANEEHKRANCNTSYGEAYGKIDAYRKVIKDLMRIKGR